LYLYAFGGIFFTVGHESINDRKIRNLHLAYTPVILLQDCATLFN